MTTRGFASGHYVPTPDELRAWADNPASSGTVPIYPNTLRRIADQLDQIKAIAEHNEPVMLRVAQEDDEKRARLRETVRLLDDFIDLHTGHTDDRCGELRCFCNFAVARADLDTALAALEGD